MAKSDWPGGGDPEEMLKHLRGRVSGRKLRLLAAAACRHVYPAAKLTAARLAAVAVVERHADGEATLGELAQEQGASLARLALAANDGWNAHVYEEVIWGATQTSAFGAAWTALRQAVNACGNAARERVGPGAVATWEVYRRAEEQARAGNAELIRDVCDLGPREALREVWRTPEVVELAEGIYRERAFESLPYLGDALEEAGCADAAVLGHLRGGGRHVPGCWALDLALGRE